MTVTRRKMKLFKKKKKIISVRRYNPSIKTGLSDKQVSERVATKNTNAAEKKYSKSLFSIFFGNVFTLFNLLGLTVFIGLLLVDADIMNYVFVLVYALNIIIGVTQETRAKICTDKLSLVATRHSKVIRNGSVKDIPSKNIVLDDIVVLSLGDQIPTDSVILDGSVEVNESLLTGESIAIKKVVGDELFAGSYITSGSCTVKAVKVGKNNYVSMLAAKAKKYKKPHSEIIGSLQIIIKFLSFIILPVGALFFTKSLIISDSPIEDAILRTSTVIIGMIPSGLMLLTSLTLAIGTVKLAKHNTLVQDLYSLEMLARVDTVCFDKTGTITDGRMTVKEVVQLKNNPPYDTNKIIGSMLGMLKDNNQTAIALNSYFGQNSDFKPIATIPFSSIRKLSAVTFEDIGTFALGAPEFVLSADIYEEIKPQIEQYASLGFRVLLLAQSNAPIENDEVPHDFIPYSIILIVDNIREDAYETVKWFKSNGVAIKVISGDNPVTVSEVSKRVGVEDADKYISLEGLTDNEVYEIANKYTVFGRVSPEQKAILIRAMKTAGHVTAMTGDGVNDVLALKEADCAITVAAGSDAVKSISHIILLDNNFNSMPKVVYEGRRVINNVQSSASLYLMKTMFTIFIAFVTLVLPHIKDYPFQLKQMNLLELVVIGAPSFFLSLQPNDKKIEGRFISTVMSKALPGAVIMFLSAALIELFRSTLGDTNFDQNIYSTIAVFAVTYSGAIALYKICCPFNKYRAVLYCGVIAVLLTITLLSIAFGFEMLGYSKLTPLTVYWHHILLVIAIVMTNTVLWSTIQNICSKIKFKDLRRKKEL